MSGDAQFSAEIEEVVLNLRETARDRRRQRRLRWTTTPIGAVGLIDGAVGLTRRSLLATRAAVAQAGAAIVPGARI